MIRKMSLRVTTDCHDCPCKGTASSLSGFLEKSEAPWKPAIAARANAVRLPWGTAVLCTQAGSKSGMLNMKTSKQVTVPASYSTDLGWYGCRQDNNNGMNIYSTHTRTHIDIGIRTVTRHTYRSSPPICIIWYMVFRAFDNPCRYMLALFWWWLMVFWSGTWFWC